LLINRLYIRKELLSDGKPKGGNKQVGRWSSWHSAKDMVLLPVKCK
jgi:hypothetical protein